MARSSSACSAISAPASQAQYQLAEQMAKLHGRFKYELVVLVGDNLYGSERPQDFKKKFEIPYKPLLDAGVKFYASLGNHDAREQRFYKLFNMDGKLYYTFNPKPDVRFFVLESTYPVPEQIQWLEKELKASSSDWKIAVFHHPLYSSGDRHGSDLRLREVLEPLFLKYNVSVVLTGHDHFYERVKPQKGITYFVVGSGGQLRAGNIDRRVGHYGEGVRYRSGVHGRRNRRRRDVLQRHLARRGRSSTRASSRAARSRPDFRNNGDAFLRVYSVTRRTPFIICACGGQTYSYRPGFAGARNCIPSVDPGSIRLDRRAKRADGETMRDARILIPHDHANLFARLHARWSDSACWSLQGRRPYRAPPERFPAVPSEDSRRRASARSGRRPRTPRRSEPSVSSRPRHSINVRCRIFIRPSSPWRTSPRTRRTGPP